MMADHVVHGASRVWKALMECVRTLAASRGPVLIQGETGSGKKVIARLLHASGPRGKRSFLTLNSRAISKDMFDSALFGCEEGASPGATSSKIGLIAAAEGGTLFLDEIGEMSGPMQASLLRVLERSEYRQVGGTLTIRANVRFVAATNHDLQEWVHQGKFRDDLLYRINTIPLRVPPLRERREDIADLAEHFLRTAHVPGRPPRHLNQKALAALESYPWPGNVRELRNVIERLLLLSPTDATGLISAKDILPMLSPQLSRSSQEMAGVTAPLGDGAPEHGVPQEASLDGMGTEGTATARACPP